MIRIPTLQDIKDQHPDYVNQNGEIIGRNDLIDLIRFAAYDQRGKVPFQFLEHNLLQDPRICTMMPALVIRYLFYSFLLEGDKAESGDGLDFQSPDIGNDRPDMVNSPKHYQLLPGVEVINIIAAAVDRIKGVKRVAEMAYLYGNAIKYLLRHTDKDNPIQDLEKAQKHIGWMIQLYKEDQHNGDQME